MLMRYLMVGPLDDFMVSAGPQKEAGLQKDWASD